MHSNNEHSIAHKLLLATIATAISGLTISAQVPQKKAQLVVGIMVDGLQSEYLDLLNQYFCEGGFNRFLNKGVVINDVDYGPGIDATAATAMIYTGAAPSVNGISASTVYNATTHTTSPILFDAATIGNYTGETYSPKALLVSTLADEVRIDNGGIGSVHSIAPDAMPAILMTGHAGNSAFWLNSMNGKWATTTYYKEVPSPISTRNFTTSLSARLDTMVWTPSIPLDRYPDIPEYKRIYPFRHTFPSNDRDRIDKFKQSACINRELTSIATDYITQLRLGHHQAIDMLNIYYSLTPYPWTKDSDTRLELMDSYLRLDADLQRLFKAIDAAVDGQNYVAFIAGIPLRPDNRPDNAKWAIPHGEFMPKRAISLLNMYLMAQYGTGDWVSGYYSQQFYLNSNLIKDKNLNIKDIRANAAEFLMRMSGISNAWTIDDILSCRIGDNPNLLRRNTTVNHSGDVFIAINPGWEIVEEQPGGTSRRTLSRAQATTAPVLILAPQIEPTRVTATTDALSIAPTVARILRIRSPNAAANPTISTIFAPINKK